VLSNDYLTETALGFGVAGDRESGANPMMQAWGGPSYVSNPGLVLNCFLGISYWDKGFWFHLTPQVGLFTVPGLRGVPD
jgi:hypothetical protein